MKKILSIFILIGFVIFNACDPMEDIYDEIDAKEEEKGIVSTFEYTLTSDDYSLIADLIEDLSPSDTLDGQFIESFEYFNDEITVQEYLPYLLNNRYPWLGPKSAAKITYNYSGEMSEDLTVYTGAEEYEFDTDDYKEIDSLVNLAGYLYPNFLPDLHIPGLLADQITTADSGDVYRISYRYSDVVPVFPDGTTYFEEGFDSDLGPFTAADELGTQEWLQASYGGDGYAKMSGYVHPDAFANEDWLVSPEIEITGFEIVTLNMKQAINYLNGQNEQIDILVSTDYSGDVSTATWTSIKSKIIMPVGNNWDWVESGDVDLSEYAEQSIYLAFKYLSSTTNAATWEITSVKIFGGDKILEGESYEVNDYYTYNGDSWKKLNDVYHLTSKDYKAMGGDPAYDKAFSDGALPKDYLPNFLSAKFAGAGIGFEVTVVFEYDNGIEDDAFTLAANYEYTASGWVSSYDYIAEVTNQFVVASNTNKWVFDPTETVVMVESDYQIIVDYVNEYLTNPETEHPENTEGYYGTSSFYPNFDIRTKSWNTEEFDSWEEALEEAIGTILLPALYPNAKLQVNGADMGYRVVFDTYDGTNGTYSMKFQVTKPGPDPEFTLVEGPDME